MVTRNRDKIRVAVFIPVFGFPSEIWAVRQCLGFKDIEPVIICWHVHPGTPADLYGLECHILAVPWKQRRTVIRRIARRLGLQYGVLPDEDEKSKIRNLLKALKIKAIICHFSWTGIRVGAAVGTRFPTIWHVHGRDVSASLENAAYRGAFRSLLPTAAKVVAVGSFQLDRIKKLGLQSDQGVLIPCGAPFKQFSLNPLPIRQNTKKVRIISVGRLSPEKGVLETIEAFSIVSKRFPGAELTIIGDGELTKAAKQLAKKLTLQEKIIFTGILSSNLVATALSKSHIFTQHSKEHLGSVEGFGVTLTEAGASGVPLVVSRLGGVVDQITDGKNGILFKPGDINAQAEAILKLAQNEHVRYEMGKVARRFSSRFDSELQIKKMEHLLLDFFR